MVTTKQQAIKDLSRISGVGISIANEPYGIGICSVDDLQHKDPQQLYGSSNAYAGTIQDHCLLYIFRGAVYFAEATIPKQELEKLKWWNWKNV